MTWYDNSGAPKRKAANQEKSETFFVASILPAALRVSKPFTKPSKGFNWASISFQRASIDFKKFQFLTRIRHISRTYGRTRAKKSRPHEAAPLDLMGGRRDDGLHGRMAVTTARVSFWFPPGQGPGVRARSVSPL